ncbi:hypothetical protein EVA_04190, partial [gut metagenome]
IAGATLFLMQRIIDAAKRIFVDAIDE